MADLEQVYRPHAKRWLEREYDSEYGERHAESLTNLLVGCFCDGDMAGEGRLRARVTELAARLTECLEYLEPSFFEEEALVAKVVERARVALAAEGAKGDEHG